MRKKIFVTIILFFCLSFFFASGKKATQKLIPITYAEFEEIAKEHKYYKGRWEYFEKVIDIVKRESPNSVLEIGPYLLPIIKNADTMDIHVYLPDLTFHHDATDVPWPIEDGQYDLCIALQLWEHLLDKQQDAFKEVMRVSKKAILSFPHKWDTPWDPIHHNIDEKKIAEWTLYVEPVEVIIVGRRTIYFFDFHKKGTKLGLTPKIDTTRCVSSTKFGQLVIFPKLWFSASGKPNPPEVLASCLHK